MARDCDETRAALALVNDALTASEEGARECDDERNALEECVEDQAESLRGMLDLLAESRVEGLSAIQAAEAQAGLVAQWEKELLDTREEAANYIHTTNPNPNPIE